MRRRLKILLSAYACEPGKGSEPEVGWQWATHLARHHDITVLTRSNNRLPIEARLATIPENDRPRFIYHDLSAAWQFLKRRVGLFQAFYRRWQRTAHRVVAAETARNRYDILHHLTFVSFRHPTAIWGHHVPTVWGPVGGIESVPWRLLPPNLPGAFASEGLRNLLNAFATSPFSSTTRWGRKSTRVLAASPQMAEFFRGKRVPVELIPAIGIDPPPCPDRTPSSADSPLRLIYCGRMLWWKGLIPMLHALRAADRTSEITLIGDGPLLSELRKTSEALGISNRVHIRGRLGLAETHMAYASHDALIFPSLHDSGGFAVLEAMSNGLPVICLDAGGPALSVEPGAGTKVPVTDKRGIISGLATAIRRYSENRALCANEGLAARQLIVRKHTWQSRIQSVIQVYEEIVEKARDAK